MILKFKLTNNGDSVQKEFELDAGDIYILSEEAAGGATEGNVITHTIERVMLDGQDDQDDE